MKAEYHLDLMEYYLSFTQQELDILRASGTLYGLLSFLYSSGHVAHRLRLTVTSSPLRPYVLRDQYKKIGDEFASDSESLFFVEHEKKGHLVIHDDPIENGGVWLKIGVLGIEEHIGTNCKMRLEVSRPFTMS